MGDALLGVHLCTCLRTSLALKILLVSARQRLFILL
jgi:hypothetical protein